MSKDPQKGDSKGFIHNKLTIATNQAGIKTWMVQITAVVPVSGCF